MQVEGIDDAVVRYTIGELAQRTGLSARTIRFWSGAVLHSAVHRENQTEGLSLMHRLANLPARERQRLVDGFVDRVFSGVEDPDALVIAEFMRQTPPRLPDDPTSAQVDAWLELAELVSDVEFERTMRKMVLSGGSDYRIDFGLQIRPLVLEHAGHAIERGIAPESDSGRAVLDRIVPADLGATDTAALREWLDLVAEPRIERYWELLSLIDGRPLGVRAVPAFAWLADAVRVHR